MIAPLARKGDPLSRSLRLATSRPNLMAGVGGGLLTLAALAAIPDMRWSTRSILGWDAGCLIFIGLMLFHMRGKSADDMRGDSARQDEGQHFILGLVLVATAASLGAVALELGLAKGKSGLEGALRVGLAIGTVAASWFLTQLIFALHYAHEFYSKARPGGLEFPGKDEPDYWDFLHFSIVIGVAAQTADIQIVSKSLRRLGTLHSLIAFVFNTVVVALSINLAAALF